MDEHDIPGVKAADVAGAHAADVQVQGKYGVDYKHYWVDEEKGKVFCLVDAPDREAASRVHEEAHGLVAHTLYEVSQGA
jgi:hypothetical protein